MVKKNKSKKRSNGDSASENHTNRKGNEALSSSSSSSSSNETPWFLSQQAMGVAAAVGVLALMIKDTLFSSSMSSSSSYSATVDPMDLCGLVMANSTLPDSGWGMFPLAAIDASQPVSFGDPIIQVPDIPKEASESLSYILHNYMWSGELSGGIHEGRVVYSVVPGVGSLANGHPTMHNLVPQPGARHDPARVARSSSPGAGAFTHYHDYSFYSSRRLEAGQELLVNYGKGWLNKISHDEAPHTIVPVERLRQNGICLDHIRPGLSNIPHAGRGAIATRDLPVGTVVAPVPLIPIASKDAMRMSTPGKQQLLLNYAYGHPKSAFLFIPYGPVVNLINHNAVEPNVKIQWSPQSQHSSNPNTGGLLLELVAISEISAGDEILVNYGASWQAAWEHHVRSFVPPSTPDHQYASSFQLEQLRTPDELKDEPYPSNLRTTCFHKPNGTSGEISTDTNWNPTTPFTFSNLYPCTILERHEGNYYTVLLQHQESLLATKVFAPNTMVTHIPRRAIIFADKLYASDQHLPTTFRHAIGFPDDIFPEAWKNLS